MRCAYNRLLEARMRKTSLAHRAKARRDKFAKVSFWLRWICVGLTIAALALAIAAAGYVLP